MGADYVFTSAYVRSLERNMLRAEQFRSMLASNNMDEICSTIQNAGYGSESDPFTADNYQRLTSQAKRSWINDLIALCDDFDGIKAFVYMYDYHNIKVLLKSEALGTDASDLLVDTGVFYADDMVDAVRNRKGNIVTPHMYEAILEAAETLARTGDPQYVDTICDKYCFLDMNEAADSTGNEFIKGFLRLYTDTINIMTYLRVKAVGGSWTYFREVFVPGGNVDELAFAKVTEADVATFAKAFESANLGEAVAVGREHYEKTGDFSILEKMCDDALIDYVSSAKIISYGSEVVLAYLYAKHIEAKNIRILMGGKLAGIAPELIAERIRKTYE